MIADRPVSSVIGEEPARRVTKWDLRRIRTRRLLLQAGREIFASQGFTTPRVEDVARAAGVSRAAFYLHFKSLEDLIKSVFEREMRWQLRHYRSLTSDIICNERRMRGWLERLFSAFRQERHYMLILYRTLSIDPTSLGLMFRERQRAMTSVGRRIPELRLFEADGSISTRRMVQMMQLTDQIEDLSLLSAFDAWSMGFDIAVNEATRAMVRFATGPITDN